MATNHKASQIHPNEQAFWDRIFEVRFNECMRAFKQRDANYCAHKAREQADLAVAERRSAQGKS